jgi:outer membrane lipoprotein-sorting protein
MVDLFDTNDQTLLRDHLAACAPCAAEFEETLNAMARIELAQRVCASPDFTERTMDKLTAELSAAHAVRPRIRTRPFLRAFATAAVILGIVLILPYFGSLGTNRAATALLAQSMEALNGLRSVHILARMRTPPGDNFEAIGAGYSFQPVEMWKEFGAAPRWRVENPGRVVVMDGTRATLFMKPNRVVHGGRYAGFIEWLKPLLDPEQVLAAELHAAQKGESRAAVRQEGPRVTLTATRKAQGEFSNDWGRNSSVPESDHTRVYQFDASTNRLIGLQVILHDSGKDTVVFEITDIRYNEPIAPELFTVTVPDDVISDVPPEQMPVNRPLPATAREAAQTFLEGLAQRDWDRVLAVYPAIAIPESLKRCGGTFQVISIGEPFQSGLYGGWFVPYEIRWVDGHFKSWNLAVRNDNPAHRWLQDGGF